MNTPNPGTTVRAAGQPKLRVIVMGVSGCGKTTIGDLVARELGVPFLDGDSLHPVENVAKMAAGTPLTDGDRWPWLATVGTALANAGDGGMVLACSALRRSYRDAIRAQSPDTIFLHLHGSKEVLRARTEGRSGHFMPPALLESQLATLEPLAADEAGVVVDIAAPVQQVVREALAGITAVGRPAARGCRGRAGGVGLQQHAGSPFSRNYATTQGLHYGSWRGDPIVDRIRAALPALG